MGDGHDRKVSNEEAQAAMQPVSMPVPKPKAQEPGVKVDTNRTPTVDGILDPKRPDLGGMDSVVLVDSISHLVETIFDRVLITELLALKPQLAEVPMPPAETDWAAKLLGFAVEAVATATLAEVGGLAVERLATDFAWFEKPAIATIGAASKDTGKAAGAWTQNQLTKKPADGGEPEVALSQPGAPLADQFVDMQRLQLVGREEDAIDMLRVIRASAARQKPGELAALDTSLKRLVVDGSLSQWFRSKVTMEWLNFIARLSLGPRPEGQATNMPGANTIGGLHEAGTPGMVQWRGTHDGFVEITVDTTSGATPSVIDAIVSGRPGTVASLKSLENKKDDAGNRYSLATIPVFRRIRLKTGDSKLDTSVAFVITPEGALEVNFDDPELASLGGAQLPAQAGPFDGFEGDQRRDANQWSERANRSAHAMAGAQRIMAVLATDHMKGLR